MLYNIEVDREIGLLLSIVNGFEVTQEFLDDKQENTTQDYYAMVEIDDSNIMQDFENDFKKVQNEINLDEIIYPNELEAKKWVTGENLLVGDVRIYNDYLYRVIQPHKTQADWTPDKTPALFQLLGKTDTAGKIKEWVQPTGAHDAYNKGDKVLFNNKVYESLINANVWSPTAYPQGWKLA